MLKSVSAGFLVVLVGCASGGGGTAEMKAAGSPAKAVSARCAPTVTPAILDGAPVYPPCGVEIQAKMTSVGIRPQYNSPRRTNCASAHLRVVVDEHGRIHENTAQVIRSTDNELSMAMIAALPVLRYAPATKDGKPVAQLVDVQWMVASRNARC